jgi:hypothetical protein
MDLLLLSDISANTPMFPVAVSTFILYHPQTALWRAILDTYRR